MAKQIRENLGTIYEDQFEGYLDEIIKDLLRVRREVRDRGFDTDEVLINFEYDCEPAGGWNGRNHHWYMVGYRDETSAEKRKRLDEKKRAEVAAQNIRLKQWEKLKKEFGE